MIDTPKKARLRAKIKKLKARLHAARKSARRLAGVVSRANVRLARAYDKAFDIERMIVEAECELRGDPPPFWVAMRPESMDKKGPGEDGHR